MAHFRALARNAPRQKSPFWRSPDFKNRKSELQSKKMGRVGECQRAGRVIEEFLGVRDWLDTS